MSPVTSLEWNSFWFHYYLYLVFLFTNQEDCVSLPRNIFFCTQKIFVKNFQVWKLGGSWQWRRRSEESSEPQVSQIFCFWFLTLWELDLSTLSSIHFPTELHKDNGSNLCSSCYVIISPRVSQIIDSRQQNIFLDCSTIQIPLEIGFLYDFMIWAEKSTLALIQRCCNRMSASLWLPSAYF